MTSLARGVVAFTVVWASLAVLYLFLLIDTSAVSFNEVLKPDTIGGFLAGVFAPPALAWFILVYREQTPAFHQAVIEQRKAILAQVLIDLRWRFLDAAFLKHGRRIAEFKEKYPDYCSVFKEKLNSKNELDRIEVESIDEARRIFSDYCHTVMLLEDKEIATKALTDGLVVYLHDTIWNLEIAKDPKFDRGRFDRLWPLYNLTRPPDP